MALVADRLGPIIKSARDKILSVASESGYFPGGVHGHEPKSAPSAAELSIAVWLVDIKPIPLRSGLSVTSARVPMMARIHKGMITEPQDDIDPDLASASSFLLAQLTADFGISGAYIDLLGAHGDPLGSTFGYLPIDSTIFRVTETVIPFIVDDVFDQEDQ